MNEKFIFATDVDGTLLMDDGNVHPETLKAFKYAYENDHIVVIATGRAVVRTKTLINKMPYVNFFVSNNGSIVYDVTNNKEIILHAVEPKTYLFIREFANKHKVNLKIHTDNDWIGDKDNEGENPTPLTKELNDKIISHIQNNPNDQKLFNGDTITQLAIFSTKEFCAKYYPIIKKELNDKCSVFLTNSLYIDINPKNISKWTGIIELAEKLNISKNNIVTFGDSGNDFEMLYNAGENGYAMGNSHDDLIKKIKPKIGSNNTGAIGETIFKYLNKK